MSSDLYIAEGGHCCASGQLAGIEGLAGTHHVHRPLEDGCAACRPGLSDLKGDTAMRFMVLVKSDERTESGDLGEEREYAEMGKFNEELVKAGVMLAGEGLHPSSKGARVRFSGGKRTVIDGPFTETKELVAGFWLWQVKSKEEAIEWLKRAPFDGGTEVEIRQVFEAEDFGTEFTPELREQEERLRAQIEANAGLTSKP
jgi:hypothetical protein